MADGNASNRSVRGLLRVAAGAAVWASVVMVTGGFGLTAGPFHFSSRRPGSALVLSSLSVMGAWALARRSKGTRQLRHEWQAVAARVGGRVDARTGWPIVAAATALLVVGYGIHRGALVAGGSDSYGYVSQADLWMQGQLRVHQPVAAALPWAYRSTALAPLGYRASDDGSILVPTYPPGLPLTMAAVGALFGRPAVFMVVPLLGGVAVWATYLLGKRLADPIAGCLAAVLLATSPVFLHQQLFPMSDIPATAWWTLTLWLLWVRTRAASAMSGVCAGLAILTRPSLAPLLGVIAVTIVWEMIRHHSRRRGATLYGGWFALGAAPCLLALAVINARLYGSPLAFGYGSLDTLFKVEHLWRNLVNYATWAVETHTPVIVLAFTAPLLLRSSGEDRSVLGVQLARVLIAFACVGFWCYAFYTPFDAWWYLRFLLPVLPGLLLLTAAAVVALVTRFVPQGRGATVALVAMLLAGHGVAYARSHAVFSIDERHYRLMGEFIRTHVDSKPVILAMQHSGSIRYYSGQLTVRYDAIPPGELDAALRDLRALGFHPFLALEQWEEAEFNRRFKGSTRLADLDWPAIAAVYTPATVKLFDLPEGDPSGTEETDRTVAISQ